MMTICNGRLTHLSNESGHYAPPPSVLRPVVEQLTVLGVAHLDEVAFETLRRTEYEPEHAMPRWPSCRGV